MPPSGDEKPGMAGTPAEEPYCKNMTLIYLASPELQQDPASHSTVYLSCVPCCPNNMASRRAWLCAQLLSFLIFSHEDIQHRTPRSCRIGRKKLEK